MRPVEPYGIQTSDAAAADPEAEVRPGLPCSQHHFFVIAQNRDETAVNVAMAMVRTISSVIHRPVVAHGE